jgi:membrane protease YdiL (CAAX protease family)
MTATSERPSTVKRIFYSQDEPRLRSGWRILAHFLLLALSLLVFSLPGALLMMVWPMTALPSTEGQILLAELLTVIAFTFATWVARRRIDHRSFRSLGLRIDSHVVSDLAVGIAIPGLLMGVVFLFESGVGWIRFEAWAWQTTPVSAVLRDFALYLLVFIFTGFEEELICRGYQLQNLAEGVSLPWAVLVSSLLFSILHLANPGAGIAAFVGIVAAGAFLAYAWIRTGQLWLSIGLHIGWNLFEGVVFGFPVSGLSVFRLIESQGSGPDLFTGGAFGPEAGLVILPSLALGAALIRLYTYGRKPATTTVES